MTRGQPYCVTAWLRRINMELETGLQYFGKVLWEVCV